MSLKMRRLRRHDDRLDIAGIALKRPMGCTTRKEKPQAQSGPIGTAHPVVKSHGPLSPLSDA